MGYVCISRKGYWVPSRRECYGSRTTRIYYTHSLAIRDTTSFVSYAFSCPLLSRLALGHWLLPRSPCTTINRLCKQLFSLLLRKYLFIGKFIFLKKIILSLFLIPIFLHMKILLKIYLSRLISYFCYKDRQDKSSIERLRDVRNSMYSLLN